jgi:hypothetical protein
MRDELYGVNIGMAGNAAKKAIEEAVEEIIEKGGLSFHELAYLASTFESHEARELAKRWKTVYAKYANLCRRYWNLMKQFQALRILPEQVEKRFVALDEEFDGVCEEMLALFDDLREWARNADTFSGRTNIQVENEVRGPES